MRLRFPGVVLALFSVALVAVWVTGGVLRQLQVILSFALTALTFVVLLAWFVFRSGAPRSRRLGVLAGVILASSVLAGLFRIRGVTGDLIPILEYRFATPKALPQAPPMPGPAPSTDAAASPSPSPQAAATAIAQSPPAPKPVDHREWPQYLGPSRNGVIEDAGLDVDWVQRPPRLLWRQPVGTGWAGFAISGEIAVTQEQRGEAEHVIAYDLRSGRPLWNHADPAHHDSPLGGVGPRAVPAIAGSQVFAIGATGILNSIDLSTGRLLWSRSILTDSGGDAPEWGVSVSPMVLGDRVIVAAGGPMDRALAAYDRNTGALLWAKGQGGLAYASPVLLHLAGRDQIVMLNRASVAGHDPETGAPLWEQPVPGGQPNVAQPLSISENRVLFSVGYGIGSKVFEITDGGNQTFLPRLVWSTPRLKSKFANMVFHEGSIYGLDDGVLVCLDPETGERRWKAGRYGHGQLILVGRKLLVQTEEGEVIMIDPNPERLTEVTRFAALAGKTWNPPALAAPILLVRNDVEAAAYELPLVGGR